MAIVSLTSLFRQRSEYERMSLIAEINLAERMGPEFEKELLRRFKWERWGRLVADIGWAASLPLSVAVYFWLR